MDDCCIYLDGNNKNKDNIDQYLSWVSA